MIEISPLNKKDFLGLETGTWLFTGAESPPHGKVVEAVDNYMRARAGGPAGRELNDLAETKCRAKIAELLGTGAESIALLSNASEAISTVVRAIGGQAGDNIVLSDLEYPSGVLAALCQRDHGVEIRVVSHENWDVSVDQIMAQVDGKTKLVVASHVSYLSGARLDYECLYERLLGTGALLLLDATQSLGVTPVKLNSADFVVSSTYKWLLAMHGAGILAVNPKRTGELMPDSAGWRSVDLIFRPDRFEAFNYHEDARRFELGFPSFATIHALATSVELLLSAGIERIEKHVLSLGQELIEGLAQLGLEVMTPSGRAGNIAWACENGDDVAAELRRRGILLWGGDGRVRASLHGFNDCGDVENLLSALKEIR